MEKIITVTKIQKVTKFWNQMKIVQTKQVIVFLLFGFLNLTSCGQENQKNKDDYNSFRKEIYTKINYPEHDIVLQECLLDGYILTLISIDDSGNPTFELLFASNQYFKDVFFDQLKQLDTSSLNKNKKFLVPIIYKLKIMSELNCKAKKNSQKYFMLNKEIAGNVNIDYIFEPFEFYGITPIK